jgi:phage repressor protein C with HTH and peptisase S24 domain
MVELLSVFGQRLSALRVQRTVRDFAKELGVHFNTLASYERGEGSPDLRFLTKISEVSGKPISWLLGDNDGAAVASSVDESQIVLPMYDVRASAGAGALVVSEDVSEHFAVGRDWLRRNLPPWAPPNAVVGVLEGSGDSMEPTIRDGDLIMVVQDVSWRIVERGGIFVFTLDGNRLLLKRLQVLNNGDLRIISDNKAYDADTVPFADIQHRIIIHGQVFFAGGKPRSY